MSTTTDPWPRARTLLSEAVGSAPRHAALVGVPTYATSVTPRSATSTPRAVRAALERYSTWSYRDRIDLLDTWRVVDYGDVDDPDGEGGADRVATRLAGIDPRCELTIVLGGDNAATWLALRSLQATQSWGLITLDAHLDMREGRSNGSPVRQLLEEGLDGNHVVQIGVNDFANSAHYARQAAAAGVLAITRDELRRTSVADVVARALAIAGADGRPVYLDVDVDVVDRAAVPGCPAAAPGGISPDELRQLVYAFAAAPAVRVIDITEIDVERDSADERTVRLAALLLLEALHGRTRKTP